MSERVLLVDDEEDFLDVMRERLTSRGMEVGTSISATDALKRISEEVFDAVILDLRMPGMDGLQALERIRGRRPELHVILLTGHATVEKAVEAIKLGAMDVVEKPADLEAIAEKITKVSQKRMLIMDKMNDEKVIDMLRRFGV